ncbi:TlpA family protein disulfide reductase [Usitatibacter palustris]|uniref:Thiol-disulfide oxidoreductase ResA n=1 Tax=Usitatibacter palustris TaxID=2732487 RepID=A0A6M4H8L1_9PROT|nr:TlpA disulfide reductase family protein [Usitatibacter palustris]QJR14714.1 Thiol-disulfide oxidoreductase ResA [Usitatibacter palustris]
MRAATARACAFFLLLCGSTVVLAVEAGAPAPNLPALAAHRGKVVYVDFWASWCVPCRLSMPLLDGLYKQKGAAGFVVVGINKDTKAENAERFLKKVPITFPWIPDEGDGAAKAFAVKAMPSGYLIDRKGVVRVVHRGFTESTAQSLAAEIDKLLQEKS